MDAFTVVNHDFVNVPPYAKVLLVTGRIEDKGCHDVRVFALPVQALKMLELQGAYCCHRKDLPQFLVDAIEAYYAETHGIEDAPRFMTA